MFSLDELGCRPRHLLRLDSVLVDEKRSRSGSRKMSQEHFLASIPQPRSPTPNPCSISLPLFASSNFHAKDLMMLDMTTLFTHLPKTRRVGTRSSLGSLWLLAPLRVDVGPDDARRSPFNTTRLDLSLWNISSSSTHHLGCMKNLPVLESLALPRGSQFDIRHLDSVLCSRSVRHLSLVPSLLVAAVEFRHG